MRTFSSPARRVTTFPKAVEVPRDVQSAPWILEDAEIPGLCLKADVAYRVGEVVVVSGWTSGRIELGLSSGEQALAARRSPRARPDVARHLKQAGEGEELGFILAAWLPDLEAEVSLTWRGGRCAGLSLPLQFAEELPADGDPGVLGPALATVLLDLPAHSPEWRGLRARAKRSEGLCQEAKGMLEGAAACELTRDAVVVGWVVHQPGTLVWLEDDEGRTWPIEGDRRFRPDVHEAFGTEFGAACSEAGFVVRLSGVRPGRALRLMALTESGVHGLGSVTCAVLPADPVGAARWLFGVYIPLVELHRRVSLVDAQVLDALIEHRQGAWNDLPVQRRQLGLPPTQPQVAVIVPLYGRSDFVEHQLLEFADDPWLLANAEIVYVIDDANLVESFSRQAEALFRLYGVPFRWVWGRVNRGFSGANNLGAAHSKAPTLIFLNSDAIPQRAGWAQALVNVLAEHPEIGVVGPRLVFADGGIQHAGMEFLRRDELGIWINHHPRVGLDPVLDPHRRLTPVPAVTGACLAVRRAHLEQVGGWDTGYLIGDFEDSDLCLKLRDAGLQIAYLPSVQLTHLERQSFKLLGQDEFRQRVVIYNAVRHQSRWSHFVESASMGVLS